MNPTGNSHFNQARLEWAIRLRYSPLPDLDMGILASQLNAFRIGELRVIGKTWEVMLERDAELAVNSDKRKADAAGLDWQVVSDGSPAGDRHAAALQYFYDHLTATKALDQDSTGGTDELIYQTLSALDTYYSAHEMLLRVDNPAAREVTCEFRHTPIWFLEARRGYLGYLQHIFDLYGQPCLNGEWLTAVNSGWMRPLSLVFAIKALALRDWNIFNSRYGSGFLDGQTTAQAGTPEWDEAMQSLQRLANDGAVLHNDSVVFKFLEQSARNALPFEPLVQWCNALYAKCYRGVDLATGSRAAQNPGEGLPGKNPVGASIQKEESGIFLLRDARWITGVFNERIDRPIIRYLFGAEPRAWFALMPPESDHTAQMLAAVQALVPMGLRLALKDIYQAFRFRIPEDDDPCLTPPIGAAPSPEEAENSNSKNQNSRNPQTPNSKPDVASPSGRGVHAASTDEQPPGISCRESAVIPTLKRAEARAPQPERGVHAASTSPECDPVVPAQTTDTEPIAPGADPAHWAQYPPQTRDPRLQTPNPAMPDTQERAENSNSKNQNSRKLQIPSSKPGVAAAPSPEHSPVIWQTANPAMPDTQVDAAAFWSRSGLMPKVGQASSLSPGSTLPMPSLGYSLPNERLENLQRLGLTNTRAAQSLRQALANTRGSAALSRRTEINGQSSSSALPTNELHTA